METPIRSLQVSKQAALIVTGTRSYTTLEHVLEVLNLHEDDTLTGQLRAVVDAAHEHIEKTGIVEPHYLQVKAAQDTAQLRQLADDPHTPHPVRQLAHRELADLPTGGHPRQVRQEARAALQRASAARPALTYHPRPGGVGGRGHLPACAPYPAAAP